MAVTEYGTLAAHIEENTGNVFVHILGFKKTKWTVSAYKEMLRVWAAACDKFAELGKTEVFVLIKADDENLEKFESLFGFETDSVYTINGIDYRIMKRSLI